MRKLKNLFENNRRWAARTSENDPEFFKILSMQQNPEYLWIGCSDSRVPANEIVDLLPGELFVHRNVANVVVHTDHNCLSVMQYAVEVLKVKHIMVVGHYGCGGVQAVLNEARFGLIDNWLRHVGDVKEKHIEQLNALPEQERLNSLIELNVIEQVRNVCRTNIVQDAWAKGQELTIHGWVYGLANGHLNDLESVVTCAEEASDTYGIAVKRVFERVAEKS
ncbi:MULTISPECIES: carbonate dehydratase [Pseudoalteromonas]|jgi:carbonic anhydrase|uniref:Carbonic anhydrase n=1 Tax=Pseudoalteromonas shioyasakiensis TaxID=1190813 RepID=A0ABT6U6Y4_9GAMM|nr:MULTISPECIES: carbonate dehydratase [Gammaproteobacteria]MCF7501538.1 carbonate dehydratase [Pseudoalteromonas sp. L1]RZF94932.1 carbonate dehydratase [Pseudoalteromonas sp. CO302Y]RZG11532.1 carbonate dehydratase [Pseudoalteromonas sp. CO133X]UJX25225.1 carbonate dehydratase [Pseudoalteromonas sp. CF6-2]MCF7517562.1 carbonate dehydratase [Pseudoalteromonas sp. L21]|tara:strand:- start:59 stop:721 length:663 start_codon:yes stop_codon:yes gene_type:complete